MNNYTFDSIVNKQEVEALKEIIFKRARERAEALNSEVQSSYTSNIRADIMDLARSSFTADRNPFSSSIEKKPEAKPAEVTEPKPETEAKPEPENNIGFSERRVDSIKAQIIQRNKIKTEEVANLAIQTTMADAHAELGRKNSFIGALDFLNSQASIALVNKKGQVFDAIA